MQVAVDQGKQRRLAGTIAPDQADFFTGIERHRRVFQNHLGATAQSDVSVSYTHLDVYKRQAQHLQPAALAGSMHAGGRSADRGSRHPVVPDSQSQDRTLNGNEGDLRLFSLDLLR